MLESETGLNATRSAIFNGERLQMSTFISGKVCYVLLIQDDVTRIITSVQFDETRSIWTVGAARAKTRHQNLRSGYRKTRCIPIDAGKGKGAMRLSIKADKKSR
jgi:hypothetical protein